MRVINSNQIFNPINNGFVYICGMDDGTVWIRSVAGKWTLLPKPIDTISLDNDFQLFLGLNMPATLSDIRLDNNSLIVNPPLPLNNPIPE